MELHAKLEELRELSADDRIRLAEALWLSVATDPVSSKVSPSQARELERRLAFYDANPSDGVRWEDLRQRLLANAEA